MAAPHVTVARLRELLEYNHETGDFVRMTRIPGVCRPGDIAGTIDTKGYVNIVIDGRRYKAHRLAWLYVHGEWPASQIDHVNMIKSDNRFENLRPATQSQNQGNTGVRKTNTSGFKGVFFKKSHSKWCALAHRNGSRWHIGYFRTPEEAHSAYVAASAELYGEFARVA